MMLERCVSESLRKDEYRQLDVLLLDIYGKNIKETISSKELNKLLELLK